MLLNRPSIFTSLTICLSMSVSACANNPSSKELEKIFAADPQLKNNPPFSQLIQTPTQNNQQPEQPTQIPADFPSEISPYPNSQLIEKSEQEQKTVWSSSDPTNVVQNFYQKEFRDKNWEIISNPTEEGIGSLVAEKNDLQVEVSLKPSQTPGVVTEYEIDYQLKNQETTNVPSSPVVPVDPSTTQLETQPSPNFTASPIPDSSPTTLFPTPLPTPGVAALPTPTPLPPGNIPPVSIPTSSESPVLEKALTDVPSGLRQYIADLSKLGIFQQSQPKNQDNPDATILLVDPQNLVTRREYVRWLVNTNNQIFTNNSTQHIRLAGVNETPIFEDVPKNDPDFAIIQGLAEAGLIPSPLSGDINVVKFRPNDFLTREDLILWKVPLDFRKALPEATVEKVKEAWDFQDASRIDPAALRAVLADAQNDFSNIRRVFGYTKLFRPDKTVSRAEAAAVLWYFGDQKEGISAQMALQQSQNLQ
ncbi:MAG: S-layer homology domain-containing protein [Okeania sp. SIO3H1]|uniref:S-layer homology domain-containing protein n=1 Tax=Okeania sp. SIO1I7 TaxID=2607772 RepID=UPI0013C69F7B|nr:S-layer homology domain-containing protein [Okeania sp. SIO1I7]NEN92786.1 S-layer homology domain-containing protein [Okeania sp. SIO3H1]NET25860.1 S-layer homology domain-containing protein [Okeania sp. SIO1I7]